MLTNAGHFEHKISGCVQEQTIPFLQAFPSTSTLSEDPSLNLDLSLEDLTQTLSQTNLDTSNNSQTLFSDDDDDDDYKNDPEYHNPSPETIMFLEILLEFSDLPQFICHPNFMRFASIWLRFKNLSSVARDPMYRPQIFSWLESASAEIHQQMIQLAKSNTEETTKKLFGAFRRLKDQIDIHLKVFKMIEHGRVVLNQTPEEVIAHLAPAFEKIDQDVELLKKSSQDVIPWVEADQVYWRSVKSVSKSDLMHQVGQVYLSSPSSSHPSVQNSPHMTHFLSWSMPVTPMVDYGLCTPFFSLPVSPQNVLQDEWVTSPLSGFDTNSNLSLDLDNKNSKGIEEDLETASFGKNLMKQKRVTGARKKGKYNRKIRTERHYTRRTATSYDAQTTHYLKTIFFDVYSYRDKLTKEQRRLIQKKTGLKPRNITYWFSNHKRRFQNSLMVFKNVVKESQGQVKTYDDFLDWRKRHGLPEEISEEEILGLENSK